MKLDKTLYPWADAMEPGMTVGEAPGYATGEYLDLFEEHVFPAVDEAVGDLRYYVYDPTLHGLPQDRQYPVIFALHGAGNALAGKLAVNYSGMELFASPAYQQRMGGAYIVCPLANEYRKEDGSSAGTWMTPRAAGDLSGYSEALQAFAKENIHGRLLDMLGAESIYTETLLALLSHVRAGFSCAGKTLVTGSSAGGYGAWRLLNAAPERFDAALLMAPAYLPSEKLLDQLQARKLPMLLCHGLHDELVPFQLTVRPHLERYAAMENVQTFLPKLVLNRDGSVASNISGIQMGQHCINNAIQNDLMLADGTPMCAELPQGVTGWIRDTVGGMTLIIRKATADDVHQIAAIVVEDWQKAYRGIIDPDFLNAMSAEKRYDIEINRYHNYVVAADGQKVLGYAWLSMTEEKDADCEVVALYVRYSIRKAGIGKRLLLHAMDTFRAAGKKRMIIWCLKDNAEARRFYERMGGKEGALGSHQWGNKAYEMVSYLYGL